MKIGVDIRRIIVSFLNILPTLLVSQFIFVCKKDKN